MTLSLSSGRRAETPGAMVHNPALDGLRGVAVLLVLLFHAQVPGFQAGFLGVDVFFVLSGFLITGLLLEEHRRSGRIRLGRFLWRRLLRLGPALWAFCLGMLVLSFWVWPADTDPWVEVLLTVFYLSDLTVALARTPEALSHGWSLAIEQHFYLVWPVLLILLLKRLSRDRLALWVGLAFLLATAWRLWALDWGFGWREVYYRLDTRLSGLMLGGCLAALIAAGAGDGLRRVPFWGGMLPLAVLVLWQGEWRDDQVLTAGVAGVELATVSLILAAGKAQGLPYRVLSLPPLRWLGLISYGLYLWHYPIFRLLRAEHGWEVTLGIGLPIALGLALLSWVTVEAWGRRMRHPGRL